MIRDIHAHTPEVFRSYEPRWELWTRELERYDIDEETILVGHSAGAGFLTKYLSIHPELKVGRVVLVAPWLDPDGTIEEKAFFEFKPDEHLAKRTAGVDVLFAVDDSESVHASIDFLKRNFEGFNYHEFPKGYGHFTYDNLKGSSSPELRDLVLREL